MSWSDEMVPVVRVLINDLGSPTTYTDSRLEEVIVVAAQLLLKEIDWDKTYVISISASSITPDPTSDARDDAFINLVCLKAASFIYDSEAKTASVMGIRITDGPSTIDISGRLSSSLALSEKFREDFRRAKIEYLAGNSRAGHAILTPYTNRIYNPIPDDNFT